MVRDLKTVKPENDDEIAFAKAGFLPPLRKDIDFMPASSFPSGEPAWTVFDPVSNRFFRIGWDAYQILIRWRPSVESLMHALKKETALNPDRRMIEDVKNFLITNNLVVASGSQASVRMVEAGKRADGGKLGRLFSKTLSFRLPLVEPDAFLQATLPVVRFLFSKAFLIFILCAALVSVYLISVQSALFFSTFLYFFDFSGLCAYAAAVAFAKVFHELGHAYAAALYGCRVPSSGVVLVAGCPMLYTDTTDTWRLDSRKKRLVVASAGVAAELALAVAASFGWLFLSDGFWRSACFLLATSGWVMTVFVNLCPLMRFDGYYILSDLTGIENLKSRSARMLRWKIGEMLFGYGFPPPERVTVATRRGMILYAVCSAAYKLCVFSGMALTLYRFAFKAAGIVLFSASILILIILPVVREAVFWKRNWAMAARKPVRLFCIAVLTATVLFFAPLSRTASAPAMFKEGSLTRIYAPADGMIARLKVSRGLAVKKGEELGRLYSLSLMREYGEIRRRMTGLEWQAGHNAFSDGLAVLQSRLAAASAALSGVREKAERLVLKSGVDGVVSKIADGVQEGEWTAADKPLMEIFNPDECRLTAFVREEDAGRLKTGGKAVFYPEPAGKKVIKGIIGDISLNALERLDGAEPVASVNGGGVPVRRGGEGRFVPAGAFFAVSIKPESCAYTGGLAFYRGRAELEAVPESLKTKLLRRLRGVWLKEGGL